MLDTREHPFDPWFRTETDDSCDATHDLLNLKRPMLAERIEYAKGCAGCGGEII